MRDGFLKIGLMPAILIFIMIAFEPPGISLPSLCAAALHECGHLLAARLLGIKLRSLEIGPLGATIRTRGSLISYGREWLLCAAGPAANLISGAAAYLFSRMDIGPVSSSTAFNFCSVSLMLALLNLLPVEGFDGGRMLYCASGSFAGPRIASALLTCCSIISVCLLWMLSVYLLLRWGSSLSLFIFSVSAFYRIFIESDASDCV